MSAFLALLAFITSPPGSWLHTLGLLVVLEAPVALALNRWWAGSGRGRAAQPAPGGATRHRAALGRLALAAGGLFALRVFALAATLVIPAGTPDALTVLPPLERASAAITALLLLWAFAWPDRHPKADVLTFLLILAALAGLAADWLAWAQSVAAGAAFYNGSTNETFWLLAAVAVLSVGVWRLARTPLRGARAGALLLGVLLAGHGLHYLFPPAAVDAPAAVRWAELLALPPAIYLLYRRASAWPLAAPAPELAPRRRLRQSPAWQLAETFLIAVLFYYAIDFTTGRFRVEGPSMQPTLHAGQFVLTDRLAYRLGRPQRGDIVVVHPDAAAGAPAVAGGHDLIKRVVGLPGEHIVMGAGAVHINGQPYSEPYLREPAAYNGTWSLGPNEYFVLGDNRNNSSDSHVWGPLPPAAFNSRALFVYWPPRDWTWVAGTPLAAAPAGP